MGARDSGSAVCNHVAVIAKFSLLLGNVPHRVRVARDQNECGGTNKYRSFFHTSHISILVTYSANNQELRSRGTSLTSLGLFMQITSVNW